MHAFKKQNLCLINALILSVSLTATAHAQSNSKIEEAAEQATLNTQNFPAFGGEVVMELQNEYTSNSDDASTDDYNNMFFRTEVAPVLAFNKNIFIDGVAVFEGIQEREPNESNFFDNEGVFVEEIKLNYESDNWAAWAGKFNPGFGIAWDYGRGIWGEDFAEDYEITEKIGFGGAYTYDSKNFGAHTLSANTFFADTTFLSGSTITNRDTLDLDDGGVSNTEDFSSYVVSLEGENLANIDNLYYKLGYRHQDEGDETVGGDDETGYVATLGHVFPVNDNLQFDALLEYADISNFEASQNDNQYFTASLITTIDQQWNVTVGYTQRNIDVDAGLDIDDELLQISAGYDFGQGTTAELGYRYAQEDGQDTDIVGGLIRHSFEF